MKKFILLLMFTGIAGVVLPAGAVTNETRTTITVRPDGTCQVKVESIQPRMTIEQQTRAWARYKTMSENDDTDETKPTTVQPKPYTDEELAASLRKMMEDREEQMTSDSTPKIEALEVGKESVRLVLTYSLASIEALLETNPAERGAGSMPSLGSTRYEKDDKGHLLVTMTPDATMKRYIKSYRSWWKASGTIMEYRLVLPGKILSSAFSNVQDNATWYIVDPKSDPSIDAAIKLYDAPVVITAELNGLKLDKPLDSKDLRRATGRGMGDTSDLPITDAGPGFVSEAVSISTSTVYYFPEGEKYLKENNPFTEEPGVIVRMKLFAPKGRYLRSVSGLKVEKAVDDKGRSITSSDTGPEMSDFRSYSSFNREDSEKAGPVQMDLQVRLALPERDAQAIQELSGEAVAITFGKWKEITVTNFTGEIDLSSILAGAKLTVSKLTAKSQQVSAQLELKGPAGIREIDIKCKTPGGSERMHSSSSLSERGYKAAGDQSTRKLTLSAYTYNMEGGANPKVSTNDVSLLVRFPEELKRERVKIKLSALDLF